MNSRFAAAQLKTLNSETPRVALRRAGGRGGGADLTEQRRLHAGGVGAVVDADHLPCLEPSAAEPFRRALLCFVWEITNEIK